MKLWHLSLLLMNNGNKTESAILPMLPEELLFADLICIVLNYYSVKCCTNVARTTSLCSYMVWSYTVLLMFKGRQWCGNVIRVYGNNLTSIL